MIAASDIERARSFIEGQEWIFAKTMADIPHYYCLLERCRAPREFLWFARLMEKHSVEGTFCGKTYRYFFLDEWKYWSMDPSPEECTLINRERQMPGKK